MIKDSIVKWVGHDFIGGKSSGFTRKKGYKVLAGQGDGVPRNDGTLGAYIRDEITFAVEDDRGNVRVQSIKSSNWELVEVGKSSYVPKPEYRSPIQLTTSLC